MRLPGNLTLTSAAHYKGWTVQRQIQAMAVVMVAVATLLVGMTFYAGRAMDQEAIARQQALIDNAFTTRLGRAVGELRSVAWWNDTVTYTAPESFDRGWLDREIGSYMVESYRHDRLIIFDEQDQPIYNFGAGTGIGTTTLANDVASTKPVLFQARGGPNSSPRIKSSAKPGALYEFGKTENRKFSRGFGAIISINGKPAIATALLITPSFDTAKVSPVRRVVMTLIDITPAVLTEIGNSTLMPDLSLQRVGDKRLGSYLLKTDDGKTMGSLSWTPKQPGTEMVHRVLPGIAVAIGSALLAMSFLVFRLFQSTKRLAEREIEAQRLANHDALTGLPNRRKLRRDFEELASNVMSRSRSVSIACIDLDRFKDINDTLGHQAGDELIRAVAARIEDMLRPSDSLARLGGDELAVIRHYRTSNDGDALTTSIAACFERPFSVAGHEIEVNASIGLTNAPVGSNFDDLMRQADIALYDAKAQGRGRSVRFVPSMAEKLQKRHSIEVDLRRALAERELTLNYQPIVEATTGAISSVEALVRWTSPLHGPVTPDVFIAIAEESGMMADLGRFVLEQAIEDAQKWPHIGTAINISPAQLRSATLVSDLIVATTRFGVSPARITLEITESVLMSSDDRTMKVLNNLKACGFSLALDDFGTGYSSLSYLRDFPFDKLKIDRSFVQGLSVDDRSLAIVEGVVNFGRILGREIVAEGIETEQEMQAMQQAGCTHLQGFLFSRALPADHIEAMAATFGRLSAKRAPTLNLTKVETAMTGNPSLRKVG